MKDPHTAARVNWRDIAGGSHRNSADPIIKHKRPGRRKPRRLGPIAQKVRRMLAKPKRRQPQADLEHGLGRQRERGGFGFRAGLDDGESFGMSASTPTFPTAAYIPSSPPSAYRLCEQMHKHPWALPSAAYGGFNIYALSPQPRRRQPQLSTHSSPRSQNSESDSDVDLIDEDEFARSLNLDLSDPRALGLYGPMVTVPNPVVRRVFREIFLRAMWMSLGVTVPIMVILLVIP
jgi:hypothetical protein